MAVIEILEKKSLVLAFQEGVDEKGNPIIKRYTYSNVDSAAAPENFVAGAEALADLYKGTLTEVNTTDSNKLIVE